MVQTYTPEQFVGAEEAAGFQGQALRMITALGLRESGGAPRPNELNPNAGTGDFSVSPWQVNYFGNLFRGRAAKYGPPELLLTDVGAGARAAWDISGGGKNWTPWSTFRGLPSSYLQQADQLIAEVQTGSPAAQVPIAGGQGAAASGVPLSGPNVGYLAQFYRAQGVPWTPPAGDIPTGGTAADATPGGSSTPGSPFPSATTISAVSGSCPEWKIGPFGTGIPSPSCVLKELRTAAFAALFVAAGAGLVIVGLYRGTKPVTKPVTDKAKAAGQTAAAFA